MWQASQIFGATQKKRKMRSVTALFIFVIYYYLKIVSTTLDFTNEVRSQRGIALLNNTYKTLYTEDYPSCLLSCMNDFQCMSLNYWWRDSTCDLNHGNNYSADSKFFSRELFSTYMGLMRKPEIVRSTYRSCRDVPPLNGDGEYSIDPVSSGNPFTVYCDMTTDGGGWTAIQMISFTEANLRLQDTWYDFNSLSNYSDHRQYITGMALLQIRNEIGFEQLRFYCHKKKVGPVVHFMTNLNSKGEAVIKFFTEESVISTKPQACDSYTVLSDDNSTLTEDCTNLGWTSADGTWATNANTKEDRIMKVILRRGEFHRFVSRPQKRDCDDREGGEASLSPGDIWGIFVR